MAAPTLTVIAGPNGSGKSTLTRNLQQEGVDFGVYINADEIELTLKHISDPQHRSRDAQRIADRQRSTCLAERANFSFETVMSHPSKIDLMREARMSGFHVVLYFVALDDPMLNVERVAQRVALGGHPVPKDRILARWRCCLQR
jgi:predicted ABC-type ATPase